MAREKEIPLHVQLVFLSFLAFCNILYRPLYAFLKLFVNRLILLKDKLKIKNVPKHLFKETKKISR